MIPSIVISPPSSPRQDAAFPRHRPSTDLATIREADPSTDSLWQQEQSRTSLSTEDSDFPHDINDNNCEQPLDSPDGELDRLKSVATRLRLQTRRPSYVAWCENLPKLRDLNSSNSSDGCHRGNEDWKTFKERRESLDEKIQWVRRELIEMKSQDHRLAVQLMRLRSEIQQLKLITSCHQHQDLIDTATLSAQEDREAQQPALCDPPFKSNGLLFALEKPLKDFGVTRLNLFARRFSLC